MPLPPIDGFLSIRRLREVWQVQPRWRPHPHRREGILACAAAIVVASGRSLGMLRTIADLAGSRSGVEFPSNICNSASSIRVHSRSGRGSAAAATRPSARSKRAGWGSPSHVVSTTAVTRRGPTTKLATTTLVPNGSITHSPSRRVPAAATQTLGRSVGCSDTATAIKVKVTVRVGPVTISIRPMVLKPVITYRPMHS